jgi:hypothetical protein
MLQPLLPKYQPRLLVVDPVTTKEALMAENGRHNPNIQDGGNVIRYMACLLSQKGGSPTSRIGVR